MLGPRYHRAFTDIISVEEMGTNGKHTSGTDDATEPLAILPVTEQNFGQM